MIVDPLLVLLIHLFLCTSYFTLETHHHVLIVNSKQVATMCFDSNPGKFTSSDTVSANSINADEFNHISFMSCH